MALHQLEKLCTLIAGRPFAVDNPYLVKTKSEVVRIIADSEAGPLIGLTSSCSHTMFTSKSQGHCGTCSQCIDRRIAILAARQEKYDPETDYVSDVFIGPRCKNEERNMGVDFARHAIELHRMSEEEMAAKFQLQISRAVRFSPRRREAAEQLIKLHKRYAKDVVTVLTQQLQRQAGSMIELDLEPSSMLAMLAGRRHQESLWRRYSERIVAILRVGVPRACKTNKPMNEPHLQEICDGILSGLDEDLVREFPFMRWSSSLTKPDWSSELAQLWVELKYVRTRADIRAITEDIAADITKYGDNERHILFIIYDPKHLVTDEQGFSEQIVKRSGMQVDFLR